MWLFALSPNVCLRQCISEHNATISKEVFGHKDVLYRTKHTFIVKHGVLGVPSNEDHQRLVIHLIAISDFCEPSPWLENGCMVFCD
jgi:hypothetical protein